MRTVWSAIIAVALVLGAGSTARANEAAAIELTRQVIETERKAIVATNMPLTEAEAEVFWPLYNDYQREMRTVSDQYISLVKRYADAFPEGADDDVARDLMTDWLAMESDSIKIRRKYVKKFDKVLPTALVLRFFQIDNKLTTIVRADVAMQVPLSGADSGQ